MKIGYSNYEFSNDTKSVTSQPLIIKIRLSDYLISYVTESFLLRFAFTVLLYCVLLWVMDVEYFHNA